MLLLASYHLCTELSPEGWVCWGACCTLLLRWGLVLSGSLGSYRPWGHKELDTTEWLTLWLSLRFLIQEGKASLRTKLVKVMEFQLSYFKSWKMMLWKFCTQYASKFGKLSSGHRTGKGQFSFQSLRKALPKNAQTTSQWHSFHTLVK